MGTCATVAFVEAIAAGILGADISSTNALQGANPLIHLDKILIGEVMLLIPGIFMTNAIHDMLVGDTVAGTMRFVETMLWAVALAGGFMTAIFLFDASHNVGPEARAQLDGCYRPAHSGALRRSGFRDDFHLLPARPRRRIDRRHSQLGAIYLAVGCALNSVFFPALVAAPFLRSIPLRAAVA